MSAIVESILEIVRQRQRVTKAFCRIAQRCCDEAPIQPGSDQQPEQQPNRIESRGIGESRQAHQQPATHIGSLRAQSCYPAAETTTAENEIVETSCAAPCDTAEHETDSHVESHGQHRHHGIRHGSFSKKRSIAARLVGSLSVGA